MGLINTSDLVVVTCISLIFSYFVPLYGTCTSWFHTSLYVFHFMWRYVSWCKSECLDLVMFKTIILLHIWMTSY